MKSCILYTDGSWHPVLKYGAWAYILIDEKSERIDRGSGHNFETTNNRMELTAVIEGIVHAIKEGYEKVYLYTDSQYVCTVVYKHKLWQATNWLSSSRYPIANKDLIEKFIEDKQGIIVKATWIPAHKGIVYNEECDAMAGSILAQMMNNQIKKG